MLDMGMDFSEHDHWGAKEDTRARKPVIKPNLSRSAGCPASLCSRSAEQHAPPNVGRHLAIKSQKGKAAAGKAGILDTLIMIKRTKKRAEEAGVCLSL